MPERIRIRDLIWPRPGAVNELFNSYTNSQIRCAMANAQAEFIRAKARAIDRGGYFEQNLHINIYGANNKNKQEEKQKLISFREAPSFIQEDDEDIYDKDLDDLDEEDII